MTDAINNRIDNLENDLDLEAYVLNRNLSHVNAQLRCILGEIQEIKQGICGAAQSKKLRHNGVHLSRKSKRRGLVRRMTTIANDRKRKRGKSLPRGWRALPPTNNDRGWISD